MNDKINKESQSLSPDTLVTLYVLDTTPIGFSDIFRFTSMPELGNEVQFAGNTYTPITIEADGFRWDGRGPFPRPRVRIANSGGIVSRAVIGLGDIVGSKFYRIRTFAKHLDTGSDPDAQATFPIDIYTVDQRTKLTKAYIEWQLASVLDQISVHLPRRQCIRDSCTHTYRRWNGSSFDYTAATCPYTRPEMYTESGEVTTISAEDACGKKITDCRLRFNLSQDVLPTRSFPGIARTRL